MLNIITLIAFLTTPRYAESASMLASWYDQGSKTASGEKFNPDLLTAAHRSLPYGTKIRLRYGKHSAEVRVNDRGPYIRGRHIDLSRGAAKALGFKGKGVGLVEVLAINTP